MTAIGIGLALGVLPSIEKGAAADPGESVQPTQEWPSYGHDARHTFHGATSLTETTAVGLMPAWFFPTGDAVTATPTVVGGTVYVGSWDGYFYAVDLRTGALRWRHRLDPQPAVTPFPGEVPRDVTSDGGLVTSSAWFEPAGSGHPDLIIFGGGYTLYALNARNGQLWWSHEYTGRPDLPADPGHDSTRIFSSPVVTDGRVIFGVSADGQRGRRGYLAAASLMTGNPVWVLETDVDSSGRILNDGCGSVWSSGTLLAREGLVVFDTADCHDTGGTAYGESVLALSIRTGQVAWQYRPPRPDPACDLDFGATSNAGVDQHGVASFLGVGGKDGTYYSLDPRTGRLRWSTQVVFGGPAGGFIGTTAYDGTRVYGATALGDVLPPLCDPSNPGDTPLQEPTAHAFDPATGAVLWQRERAASFSPTTVAGGMTFNGLALNNEVQVRDAATGDLVARIATMTPSWSGIATVGNAAVFGTGTVYAGAPDGIEALTPGGVRPALQHGGAAR